MLSIEEFGSFHRNVQHTFWNVKTRVATKWHTCSRCGGAICPGESYHRRMYEGWIGAITQKQHLWDCSLQAKKLEDTWILHQRFNYMVIFGRTLMVRLEDVSTLPRWHQRLLKFMASIPVFRADAAWFTVSKGALSGPFGERKDAERFLISQ